MSMNGHIRRITPARYEQARQDPVSLKPVVGMDYEALQRAVSRLTPAKLAKQPPQIRAWSEQMLAAARGPRPSMEGVGPAIDLQKSWHILHFLLAGDARKTGDGAGRWILGGEPCGDDLGYGPARLLSPREVAEIAAALPEWDAVGGRVDPEAFAAADLYPKPEGEDAAKLRDWIGPAYQSARAIYSDAAAAGDALVLWLD